MSTATFYIFEFIALIFSVMVHEVSHGLMAEQLGDSTARDAGRITLNPLKHIDLFGSILLPILLLSVGSPVVLGWAKPVPYDPNRLPNPKAAAGKIGAAGPLSNFILAAVFGILVRLTLAFDGSPTLAGMFALVVIVNLSLGIFNLVPIPPLDGSKVLYALLPSSRGVASLMYFLERYGIILIFVLLWMGGGWIAPVVGKLFGALTGQALF